jgi:hypothetical protein
VQFIGYDIRTATDDDDLKAVAQQVMVHAADNAEEKYIGERRVFRNDSGRRLIEEFDEAKRNCHTTLLWAQS